MSLEKNPSFDSISESIDELCRRIDEYNRLVTLAVNPGREEPIVSSREFSAPHPVRIREARLMEAIRDAIEELEESRKSFKSKRLEELRKKLIRVLMEV